MFVLTTFISLALTSLATGRSTDNWRSICGTSSFNQSHIRPLPSRLPASELEEVARSLLFIYLSSFSLATISSLRQHQLECTFFAPPAAKFRDYKFGHISPWVLNTVCTLQAWNTWEFPGDLLHRSIMHKCWKIIGGQVGYNNPSL